MNAKNLSRWSFVTLVACIVVTPLATSATSLRLTSLPLTYDQFVIPKLATLSVLIAAAVALWATSEISAEVRWRRSAWIAAALLGLAVLSTAFALDPAVAVFGKDAGAGLLAMLGLGGVFFLVLQHVSSAGRVAVLARSVVGSAATVSALSLFQAATMSSEYVGGLGLGAVGYLYGRGGGVMGNPDYVGAFLVAPFVLSLALVAAEKTTALKWSFAGAAALIGAALVVTQVRGAWIGALLGVAVLGVLLFLRRALTGRTAGVLAGAAAVAVALGAAIASVPLLLARFTASEGATLDEISSGRLSGWADSMKVIADRPMLGTGPDLFSLGWYRHATALADRVTGQASYFEDPHNLYLAVAATLGVPALVALLALVVAAARAGWMNLRLTEASPHHTALFAGWLAALAGLATVSFFAVTTIPALLLLVVTLAVLLTPGARTHTPAQAGVLAGRGVAGVLSVLVLIAAMLPLAADYHLGQYMRTRERVRIEKARSLAPWDRTVQLEYLGALRDEAVGLLEAGGDPAAKALDTFDTEAFTLVEQHPHELQYQMLRVDLLGQAGSLGGTNAEKALSVATLASADYPLLADLVVARARALNNLERYSEARDILEPLINSVTRDAALVETYLLLGHQTAARELLGRMQVAYESSPYAQAFFAQESIAPYLSGSTPGTP